MNPLAKAPHTLTKIFQPMVFEHLSEDFYYIEGKIGDAIYGWMAIDFEVYKFANLHLKIINWTPTVAKVLQAEWPKIKNIMRAHGAETVIVTNYGTLEENQKWKKFIKFFDFPNPIECVVSKQEL